MKKCLYLGSFFAVLSLILDQSTKALVLDFMVPTSYIKILPIFDLVLLWNRGVSFGFLNNLNIDISILLSVLAFGISIILTIWLFTAQTRLLASGLGMIIGGAIGNAIDRLRFGAVTDFLYFHWHNFSFPAFNIADTAITIGVFLILIDGFINPKGASK